MLYGKELVKSIQKRCKIQPGMLVNSTAGSEVGKVALVLGPHVRLTETMKEQRNISSINASPLTARQTS